MWNHKTVIISKISLIILATITLSQFIIGFIACMLYPDNWEGMTMIFAFSFISGIPLVMGLLAITFEIGFTRIENQISRNNDKNLIAIINSHNKNSQIKEAIIGMIGVFLIFSMSLNFYLGIIASINENILMTGIHMFACIITIIIFLTIFIILKLNNYLKYIGSLISSRKNSCM